MGYTPHEGNVTYSRCGASYRQHYWKWYPCFWKRKIFSERGL